ncbi:MAG: MFS transporter [Actinomycetes bacterium]
MLRKFLDHYFKDLPREVAVLTTVAFCVALGFGIVAPVIPVFAKSFGVSAFAASAVVSVFAFMRFIGATPAGWFVNIVGERAVLWVGLAIVSVSSALAGMAQTFDQLLILRGLGGIGSAMFTVSSMSLLLRTVNPAHRGRATSTYQSGFLLGGLAGPAVGGVVVGISIRAPFFVYSGTLLLAVCTAYFALPRGLGHPDKDLTQSDDVSEKMPIREALGLRAYWTALVVNLSTGMTSFGLRSALLPLFVIQVLHRSPSTSAYGFLVTSIVQASLLLPAGRMTDTRGRKPSMIIGSLALVAAMLCLVLNETLYGFFGAMMFMGLGAAFLGSAPAAVVGDVVGSRRGGAVVATYQMTSDLGIVAGPLIYGYLTDVTGGFALPFLVGLSVAIASTVMVAFMPETRVQAQASPSGLHAD